MHRLSSFDTTQLMAPLTKKLLKNVNDDGVFHFNGKLSGIVQYEALSALCSYRHFFGKEGIKFNVDPLFSFLENKICEDGRGRAYVGKQGTTLRIQALGIKAYAYYLMCYPDKASYDTLLALLMGCQYMLTNGPIYKGVIDENKRLRYVELSVDVPVVKNAVMSAISVSQQVLRHAKKQENKKITAFVLSSIMKDFISAKALMATAICLENNTASPERIRDLQHILLDNYKEIEKDNPADRVLVYSAIVDYLDASLSTVPANLHVRAREVKDDCIEKFAKTLPKYIAYSKDLISVDPDSFSSYSENMIKVSNALEASFAFESFSSMLPDAQIINKLKKCDEITGLPISYEQKQSLISAIAKVLR